MKKAAIAALVLTVGLIGPASAQTNRQVVELINGFGTDESGTTASISVNETEIDTTTVSVGSSTSKRSYPAPPN